MSQLPQVPFDSFSKLPRTASANGTTTVAGHNTTTHVVQSNTGGIMMNENSEFDLEESEFNNIDKNEQKEIY